MIDVATKIIVATHKKADMPEDSMYLPLLVGADVNASVAGYTPDNTGENISSLNPMYCELTGLYWAWKNLEADNIGLVHYRRLFKGKDGQAISSAEVGTILSGYKVILPKKRRYYIETLYSHYVHTHNNEEIDETAKVIETFYPDYKDSYDKIMKQTWGYMFNMMVLPKSMLDDYCTWLFDILAKVVDKVGEGDRSAFEKRYPGRLGELLFNCWLDHQSKAGDISKSDIIEVPLLNLGDEKFMKKLIAFLRAKFFGKKQDKSF
ncbi:hypothetical protein SAMN06296952_1032 [Oscillospiraceae bacterium]|nr:hypothetical protein SAMN06296952_1032 [Oscillospiraceae bacterium]